MSSFDAIVLAGGRARRLGGADKPLEMVGGRSLLERVLAAVQGARRTIVVGPRREAAGAGDAIWTLEEPAGAGPACAIAAGARHAEADLVVILAADMPFIAPAIGALRTAIEQDRGADAALLRADGREAYLAAAWRGSALTGVLATSPPSPGDSARSLYRGLRVAVVEDAGGWSRDCDTWEDLALARREDASAQGKGARP